MISEQGYNIFIWDVKPIILIYSSMYVLNIFKIEKYNVWDSIGYYD